jgi:hypothetical protein
MANASAPNARHFRDHGGLVQLRLESAADLENMHTLDPARWSATSVPTDQLLCDAELLAFLDGDKNGRVRVHDLLAAHDWLRARLKNRARFAERTDVVRFADLDDAHPDVPRLKKLGAERLNAKDQVTLAEIRAFAESYKKKLPNGDGIVSVAQAKERDAGAGALAQLIVDDGAGVEDLSGDKGASQAALDAFVARGRERLAWEDARTQLHHGDEHRAASVAAAHALAAKLDQFFAQCDLVG